MPAVQGFFDKITHGQARIMLLSAGILLTMAGGIVVFMTRPEFNGWLFHAGGVSLTVGVIVIALELTGQRRLLRMGFGFAVTVLGVVLFFLPGPGFVFVLLGLGVLAADFKWARDLLQRAKDLYHKAIEKGKLRRARKNEAAQQIAETDAQTPEP